MLLRKFGGWLGQNAMSILGLGGGAVSQERTNRINQAEAAKNRSWQSSEAQTNRAFQERMRNTSWQAAVSDMQAAGINPALAYSQGGASAPSGSMGGGATASPAGDTVSSALQARAQMKTLQLLDQQVAKAGAEARSAAAQARLDAERSRLLLPHASISGMGSRGPDPGLWQLVDAELATARAGSTNMQALAARNSALARIAGPMATLSDQMGTLLPILGGVTAAAGPAGGLARAFMRRRYRR